MCAQAYTEGSFSGGQIEAIVSRLDDELTPIFAAQEDELVPYLLRLNVAGVSRAMGHWVALNRPEPTEPAEPDRSLQLSRTLGDRWVLDGLFDPEGGSVLAAAIRLATPDRSDGRPGAANRRADALSTSAASTSTTSSAAPAAVTGPTSTSSSS